VRTSYLFRYTRNMKNFTMKTYQLTPALRFSLHSSYIKFWQYITKILLCVLLWCQQEPWWLSQPLWQQEEISKRTGHTTAVTQTFVLPVGDSHNIEFIKNSVKCYWNYKMACSHSSSSVMFSASQQVCEWRIQHDAAVCKHEYGLKAKNSGLQRRMQE
jgi:hypothetical protein